MLTIYHAPRTRSLRLVWLCEEMGLPYEVRPETFGQPSAEFLDANPLGAFPGFRDGEVRMGESTAIMQYITERYGPTPLALKADHPRFADYLQFVTFGEASLAAYMNPVIATQFGAPEGQRDNFTTEAAKSMFIRRLGAVEKQLEKGDYLAGDFTAADISVGYALGLGAAFGLTDRYPSTVADYHARLNARPALQAAMTK
ncbi:MAG TPA: glutathione S-transferase family protein [Caulobacteraceae bacterium]|nr:glutathione S-transferase family protein [Caulobacteraceae bacterium]